MFFMRNRLKQKTTVKVATRLTLRTKLIVGAAASVLIAGIIILILVNTGSTTQSKAETNGTLGPSSNNAYFDASYGSYIDFGRGTKLNCISDLPNGNKLTITMWLRWTDKNSSGVGPWANLLSLCDSTGSGDNGVFWVQHNQTNTNIEFAINSVGGTRQYVQSTTKPVEGTWYHIACVYNGTPSIKKMYIYVNGILEATSSAGSGKIGTISNKARLNMGRWCNPQDAYRHFNGFIDEVSIWNTALTSAQITTMMSSPASLLGNSYNASGLIGYWNFNNKTANDLCGCKNNGVSGSGVTLPVEFISFTGKKNSSDIELKWITASETNNDYFQVERSTDGIIFNKIGSVTGAGNSNEPLAYKFSDAEPDGVINYYRLKQVDFDGAFKYSSTVVVNMSGSENAIGTMTAGPNPFTDIINVNYNATAAGKVQVLLYDLSGKIIKKKEAYIEEGSSTLFLDDCASLQQGIYLAGIVCDGKSTPLIKLVKS